MTRPRIAIPARVSSSAAALRYEAEVSARKLVEAVYAAGGEPLSVHPSAPGGTVSDAEVARRLDFADGVLLPGGGDLHPAYYGGAQHESLYDMDLEQDAFDLAVARWSLRAARPLLAICRGMQVVNVAMGGTLEKRGLLERRAHPDDARRVLLSLTPAGLQLMAELFPLFNKQEALVVESLSADEIGVLAAALRKIVVDLENGPASA